MPHAVSRLRTTCLTESSTRPRLDRGEPRKLRCDRCRLVPSHCLCGWRPVVHTRAAVCLVMAEFEALKPSNTGWLVADVVPDTMAYRWSRTQVDPALVALLADPQWQPFVVFPGEFAEPGRVVTEVMPTSAGASCSHARDAPDAVDSDRLAGHRRPLFVLLDGTWSEARKIFNKSPYLDPFPVLSLRPGQGSRYRLRRSTHQHYFCTSEVAALCLALAGDLHAAHALEAYLDVFSDHYLRARQSVPPNLQDEAHLRLRALQQPQPEAWTCLP